MLTRSCRTEIPQSKRKALLKEELPVHGTPECEGPHISEQALRSNRAGTTVLEIRNVPDTVGSQEGVARCRRGGARGNSSALRNFVVVALATIVPACGRSRNAHHVRG